MMQVVCIIIFEDTFSSHALFILGVHRSRPLKSSVLMKLFHLAVWDGSRKSTQDGLRSLINDTIILFMAGIMFPVLGAFGVQDDDRKKVRIKMNWFQL